jgi:hydroxymethylpyrimidine/phosphomethylpyrimidine kinase
MKKYPRVLTIAGSDSGGGAGIQADLKTISALGCYGTSVITAITAQNTLGIIAIHPVPVDIIEKQIEAVLSDIGTDSVKIGMLHSVEVIQAVKRALIKHNINKVVLDPVMVSTSGDKLIEDNAIETLIDELFPVSYIITPNLAEASIILNNKSPAKNEMVTAAVKLLKLSNNAVLLKGGHLEGDTIYDIYIDKSGSAPHIFENPRIHSHNVHGTGCTLSSAIAACLARGYALDKAVKYAQKYIYNAIYYGKEYKTGNGHGPVNHFFNPLKLQ